jgi:hypothetical protein
VLAWRTGRTAQLHVTAERGHAAVIQVPATPLHNNGCCGLCCCWWGSGPFSVAPLRVLPCPRWALGCPSVTNRRQPQHHKDSDNSLVSSSPCSASLLACSEAEGWAKVSRGVVCSGVEPPGSSTPWLLPGPAGAEQVMGPGSLKVAVGRQGGWKTATVHLQAGAPKQAAYMALPGPCRPY